MTGKSSMLSMLLSPALSEPPLRMLPSQTPNAKPVNPARPFEAAACRAAAATAAAPCHWHGDSVSAAVRVRLFVTVPGPLAVTSSNEPDLASLAQAGSGLPQ